MNITIDPVLASRIQEAWRKLSPEQKRRIAPIFANSNQHALTIAHTKSAPVPDAFVIHDALLAKSALSHDSDGLLKHLDAGVILDIQGDGAIIGTGKYQNLDPGWLESVAEWLEHLIIGKVAFVSGPPNPIIIPDDVLIAIAGDWGTGNWRTHSNPAPSTDVARHMSLLQPHITVHLGDVYYAGTDEEENHLLLKLWPTGSLGALTLNSNHEMYSGGKPYFRNALGSKLFRMQQACSFFAFENNDWVIVGLDSAYYADELSLYQDGLLAAPGGPTTQLDFLKAQAQKGKRVIVLTHHNGLPLSGDSSSPSDLWRQVTGAFSKDGGGPDYWYWGHIHAGAVYNKLNSVNTLCRCCGHGALPWGLASVLQNNPRVEWYENRNANDPDIPQRVLNGFAVLHLKGREIQETFYDENGGVAWRSA